jgi:uncharacterized protein involved in exopolysaccharide biosynthesis
LIRPYLIRLANFRALPFLVGGALLALVIAWTVLATPRYRSNAMLQVERPRGSSGLADAVSAIPGAALLGVGGGDEIDTHIGILRSRRLLDAVIDSLALTVQIIEPAVPRDQLISARVVADPAAGPRREHEGLLHATLTENGTWALRGEELRPEATLPAAVRTGEAFRVGDLELTILVGNTGGAASTDGILPPAESMTLQFVPRYAARGAVNKRLEVRRQAQGAQLIALQFEDADPAAASRVLAALLAEHREFVARTASGDAGATATELRRQIDQQQTRLRTAEEDLRRFQERTGLVLPEEQGAAQIERYGTLRTQLDALSVERDALARVLALVDGRAANGTDAQAYRQLATFPSLITNRAIQDLLLNLMTLENDRSELRLLRSDENADVRQLTARITELERQLQRMGTQYLESLDEQIAPTRSALGELDREIARLPEQELTFVRLSRERVMLNEGYLLMQKQLRTTELQDALRLDEVRVVDEPSLPHPDDPQFPKPLVNFVLGLVLAITGAGAIAAAQAALRLSYA